MPASPDRPPSSSTPRSPTSATLRRLANAFLEVGPGRSLDDTAELVTQTAREVTGAARAVGTFAVDPDWTASVTAVSTAPDRGRAAGRGPAGGSGLPDLVRETHAPLRLTRAQIESHPAWEQGSGGPGELPARGWMAAPLVATDGHDLGLLEVSDKADGDFTADDEALLVQLALLASLALENATLSQRQAHAAQELQRRMLPEDLPSVGGLDVAVRYVSASDEGDVGGDWYDVIPLSARRVGLVIGDVMGRGVRAASVMGQLRIGLRAYALEGLGPGQVLQRLARLVASLGGEYLVTAVYAIWDFDAESLTFATAGHLPPLLRSPEGTVTFLEGDPGVPIGVSEEAEYVEHRLDAPAGATLLLYTDGLVERRDVPLDRTLDFLARAARGGSSPAAELADRALAAAGQPDGSDDVAVLVASRPWVPPVPDAPGVLDALTVPPLPAAVRRVRRWLVGAVARVVAPDTLYTLALLTTEIVTNAIVHAGTPVTVTVHRDAARIRVSVIDQQPHVPSIARFRADSPGGRGMGLVEALADSWGVDVATQAKTVWFELAIP